MGAWGFLFVCPTDWSELYLNVGFTSTLILAFSSTLSSLIRHVSISQIMFYLSMSFLQYVWSTSIRLYVWYELYFGLCFFLRLFALFILKLASRWKNSIALFAFIRVQVNGSIVIQINNHRIPIIKFVSSVRNSKVKFHP